MATLADRAGNYWESHYPCAFGVAGGLALYFAGPDLFQHASALNWNVAAVYSAAFQLASIFSAFLFTFYSFIVTSERGFIAKSKNSRPYRMLISYTFRAMALGIVVITLSIPMMLVEPIPISSAQGELYAVSIWFGITIWAIAAFARAAHIFSIFAGQHN